MKPLIVLLAALLCSRAVHALERIGMKEAMQKDMISLSARANGNGYHNKSLHLAVTNKTNKAIHVVVDPALIFRPDDTAMQDFVLAGTDLIVLNAGKTVELDEQVFCGKSYAHSPERNMNFTFLKQGDSVMIQVMGFINQYKLYDGLGQDAVWALTNRHELNGVYDPARHDLSIRLQEFMAKLTGWKMPEYYKQYAHNARGNGPVVQPKSLKMLANFDWKLEAPKVLTLGIYNRAGRMVQPVVEHKEFGRGGHRVRVQFEAEGVETGTYYIRLMDNTTVMKELAVKVD
jgi:hypothetical protein